MWELLPALTSFAAALAAVLAWAAKLWWGKEYAAAKEEVVRAKEGQIKLLEKEINNLRELTPMKIREYFLSVREQLEEYVERLKEDLAVARREVSKKEEEIGRLQNKGETHQAAVEELRRDKERIEAASAHLQTQLRELQRKYEGDDVVVFRMPTVDTAFYDEFETSVRELRNSLTYPTIDAFNRQLSEALRSYASIESLFPNLANKPRSSEGNDEVSEGKDDPDKQDS